MVLSFREQIYIASIQAIAIREGTGAYEDAEDGNEYLAQSAAALTQTLVITYCKSFGCVSDLGYEHVGTCLRCGAAIKSTHPKSRPALSHRVSDANSRE